MIEKEAGGKDEMAKVKTMQFSTFLWSPDRWQNQFVHCKGDPQALMGLMSKSDAIKTTESEKLIQKTILFFDNGTINITVSLLPLSVGSQHRDIIPVYFRAKRSGR